MKTDLVVAGYIFHKDKVLLVHHRKLDLWLPVGGHIDPNETPDQALRREIKEETQLDVEILNKTKILANKPMAVPFHADVHSVGDHDHYCLNYICKALNPEQLKINPELKNVDWFSKQDLNKDFVIPTVRNICLAAFDFIENHF